MRKRLSAIVLALCLTLPLAVPAFAAGSNYFETKGIPVAEQIPSSPLSVTYCNYNTGDKSKFKVKTDGTMEIVEYSVTPSAQSGCRDVKLSLKFNCTRDVGYLGVRVGGSLCNLEDGKKLEAKTLVGTDSDRFGDTVTENGKTYEITYTLSTKWNWGAFKSGVSHDALSVSYVITVPNEYGGLVYGLGVTNDPTSEGSDYASNNGSQYFRLCQAVPSAPVVQQPIASTWALPELEEAEKMGLIPEILKDVDLTKPITRQEFAWVSVKVWESISGTAAVPAAVNPFTDCDDVEVLKAYQTGITAGTGDGTTFSPDVLLDRETAATMLTRVYKAIVLPGWTYPTDAQYNDQFKALFTVPAPFADDADISDWARDSAYFCVAKGIILGSDGKFKPRAVTDEQAASGYAMATREAALLMALRMVKNCA